MSVLGVGEQVRIWDYHTGDSRLHHEKNAIIGNVFFNIPAYIPAKQKKNVIVIYGPISV